MAPNNTPQEWYQQAGEMLYVQSLKPLVQPNAWSALFIARVNVMDIPRITHYLACGFVSPLSMLSIFT